MKLHYKIGLIFLLYSCNNNSKILEAEYAEPHRLQFHFSPQHGWMNDPNGLVYYDGNYHLFYQYYPDSTVWGPMHWGHATSTDLVHWQHQPIALYPDSLGYIFSGSAVIDTDNTSGFARGSEKTMVAIFTYHDIKKERAGRLDRESQAIAFSNDQGKTWTKYAGNPVIRSKGDRDFRDPKVLWHEETKHWILPLAVGDHLEIFSSPNLKEWVKESEFGKNEGAHGGTWECPDLFPLRTPDGKTKWVLIQNIDRGAISGGSGTQYFIGAFDGKNFTNDNKPDSILWLDYGPDNYAGVTWFGAPNNRRIFIGWMSNWDDYATKVPTSTWRSAMTVPRELKLLSTPSGLRLGQQPVEELKVLNQNKTEVVAQNITDSLVISTQGIQKEITLEFDLHKSSAQSFGFVIANDLHEKVIVGFDKKNNEFFIDRTASGNTSFSKKFAKKHVAPYVSGNTLKIQALIDNSSIEVFLDDGKLAMTEIFFPTKDFSKISLFSNGGKTALVTGELHDLKSVWR